MPQACAQQYSRHEGKYIQQALCCFFTSYRSAAALERMRRNRATLQPYGQMVSRAGLVSGPCSWCRGSFNRIKLSGKRASTRARPSSFTRPLWQNLNIVHRTVRQGVHGLRRYMDLKHPVGPTDRARLAACLYAAVTRWRAPSLPPSPQPGERRLGLSTSAAKSDPNRMMTEAIASGGGGGR